MDDGNGDASEQAKRNEALLVVGEAVVFKGEGGASEHTGSVDEVEAMLLDVQRALTL